MKGQRKCSLGLVRDGVSAAARPCLTASVCPTTHLVSSHAKAVQPLVNGQQRQVLPAVLLNALDGILRGEEIWQGNPRSPVRRAER